MIRRTVLRRGRLLPVMVAALVGAVSLVAMVSEAPTVEAKPCQHRSPHPRCPRPTRTPPAATTTVASTTTLGTTTTTTAPAAPAPTAPAPTAPAPTAPAPTAPAPTAPAPTAPAPTAPAPSAPGPVVPGAQFTATFNTPEDFYNRFNRQVFFGQGIDRSTISQWQGDHNHSCEGPTTQRTVHSDGAHDNEMFWWCAPTGDGASGHIMTSMYTEGYAQVDFSPNRSFRDVRRVCWDQSLTSLPRKWTQVILIPEDLYQANDGGLHYGNPGLQPVPATGTLAIGALPTNIYGEPDGIDLHRTEEWAAGLHGAPPWNSFLLVFTNGSVAQWSRLGEESYYNAPPTDDKATRFRQCMTDNENGTITHVNQLADGRTRTVTLRGVFPDGDVRVIFQDDTYDSFKTDLGDRSGGANPLATWHWDNITID